MTGVGIRKGPHRGTEKVATWQQNRGPGDRSATNGTPAAPELGDSPRTECPLEPHRELTLPPLDVGLPASGTMRRQIPALKPPSLR